MRSCTALSWSPVYDCLPLPAFAPAMGMTPERGRLRWYDAAWEVARTPNLVFIMSDEARKDVVFHDKYPFVRTPNIDSLRGEAVSFHHCFANYPVCVPSRSSMITGRYPHQIGVLRNSHRLPADERDLGHHLSAHSFDCVSFGKTHTTLDDTLVVLVSDHGDQLGEHGMAGKMGNLYEASVRVPLVIRLPGGALAGAERAQMAEMVDLLPTICDVLGVPHPDGRQAPVGRSLAPVVADPRAEHRSVVHAMLLEGQMARSRDLKLNFYADDRCELYDLATDPGETVNRYDDPAYRDRRQELLEKITRFLIRHPRVPDCGGNGFFG